MQNQKLTPGSRYRYPVIFPKPRDGYSYVITSAPLSEDGLYFIRLEEVNPSGKKVNELWSYGNPEDVRSGIDKLNAIHVEWPVHYIVNGVPFTQFPLQGRYNARFAPATLMPITNLPIDNSFWSDISSTKGYQWRKASDANNNLYSAIVETSSPKYSPLNPSAGLHVVATANLILTANGQEHDFVLILTDRMESYLYLTIEQQQNRWYLNAGTWRKG